MCNLFCISPRCIFLAYWPFISYLYIFLLSKKDVYLFRNGVSFLCRLSVVLVISLCFCFTLLVLYGIVAPKRKNK